MATLLGQYEPFKSPYQMIGGKFLQTVPKSLQAKMLSHLESRAEQGLQDYLSTDWKAFSGKAGRDADVIEEKPGNPVMMLRYSSTKSFPGTPWEVMAVTYGHHVKPRYFSDTVMSYDMVAQVSNHCDLMKSISAPAMGGMISSREFLDVVCSYRCKRTGSLITYATEAPEEAYSLAPTAKNRIRGSDVQSVFIFTAVPGNEEQTFAEFSFCSDPCGGLPKWLLRQAMPVTMKAYAVNMRKILAAFPSLADLVREAPEAAG